MAQTSYAVIGFDGIELLLPQQEVITIEMQAAIEPSVAVAGSVGKVTTRIGEWPVFALDAGLARLAASPPDYRACVALNAGPDCAYALACEQVGTIALADAAEARPLQAFMRLPGNPVEALLPRDGKLYLISDAVAMLRYLTLEVAA